MVLFEYMKKCLLLLPLLLAPFLSGCNEEVKTYTFNASFNYRHIMKDDEFIASLLFDNAVFKDGFESLKAPSFNLVAGDRLTIKYTGELLTNMSSPGQTYIYNGELKEYSYWETFIITESSISSKELKEKYILHTEYIIVDNTYHYMNIDEYEGTTFYLSVDNSYCQVGFSCSPAIPTIVGIYAFNPRSSNK